MQAMREILIEELHNHLYLKSYYCDARWQPYTRGQTCCQSDSFSLLDVVFDLTCLAAS